MTTNRDDISIYSANMPCLEFGSIASNSIHSRTHHVGLIWLVPPRCKHRCVAGHDFDLGEAGAPSKQVSKYSLQPITLFHRTTSLNQRFIVLQAPLQNRVGNDKRHRWVNALALVLTLHGPDVLVLVDFN